MSDKNPETLLEAAKALDDALKQFGREICKELRFLRKLARSIQKLKRSIIQRKKELD